MNCFVLFTCQFVQKAKGRPVEDPAVATVGLECTVGDSHEQQHPHCCYSFTFTLGVFMLGTLYPQKMKPHKQASALLAPSAIYVSMSGYCNNSTTKNAYINNSRFAPG